MNRGQTTAGSVGEIHLSLDVVRFLYREILASGTDGFGEVLPRRVRAHLVRNYVERRNAAIECRTAVVRLQGLFDRIEPKVQSMLAQSLRQLIVRIVGVHSISMSGAPGRFRRVAMLIEAYRVVCAALPVDLTLPPPLCLSLAAEDWERVDHERAALQMGCEQAGDANMSERLDSNRASGTSTASLSATQRAFDRTLGSTSLVLRQISAIPE
jgi:hypothetical protein